MKPIIRSYLIEINLGASVPGAGSQVYINDYPTLRNVWFCGAMSHSGTTIAVSPSGRTVVSSTGEASVTATFVDNMNMEIIHNYPLRDLDPFLTSGFYRDYKPFRLQLTKSYITINTTTNLSPNQSIILNVLYYTDQDLQNATASSGPGRVTPRRRK